MSVKFIFMYFVYILSFEISVCFGVFVKPCELFYFIGTFINTFILTVLFVRLPFCLPDTKTVYISPDIAVVKRSFMKKLKFPQNSKRYK